MSARNKKLVQKINNAIAKSEVEFLSIHLADDIVWNIVGMPVIRGKKNFLEAVKMMEIENFNDVIVKNIIAEGDYVVVETTGKENASSLEIKLNLYYCDIYQVKKGKIQELTTYVVDAQMNNGCD